MIMVTRLTAVAVLTCVALICIAAPALAAEGQGTGADALNPVNADGYNFRGDLGVWTAVVFLVVLAILGKFAWGPISDGLQKRENEIAAQIAEASEGTRKPGSSWPSMKRNSPPPRTRSAA